MIERYFIIRPDAPICKALISYNENIKKLNKAMIVFSAEEGIETHEYWAGGKSLAIVPTPNDKIRFDTQLKKDVLNGGLRMFKKNSDIGKKWAVIATEIEPQSKPRLWEYYHNMLGRMRTRLFEIDGVVYCSIEREDEFIKPDDFTEIKGSEFFKIIEDFEEQKNES